MRGDLTKMNSLLAAGADDSVKGFEGKPALHAAIQNRSIGCVQLLLRRGSDVLARDKYGNTALQAVAFSGDNVEILAVLYAAGASGNTQERHGTSILASAACLNHARTAEWLLRKGADIGNTGVGGCTPLYEAGRYRNDEVAEVLLRHNARVDFRVADGRNIVHALASSSTVTSVQILMIHLLPGLDADCEDLNGITAWSLFEKRVGKPDGMQDAFSLLLDYVRRQRLDIDEDEGEKFADAFENFDSTD